MDMPLADAAEFIGQVLHYLTQCRQPSAPTSTPFDGVPNMLTQLLKGQADMAVDLSRLQADQAKAIALLATLPGLKAQLTELQAKLADAPHEDPSVQQAVDKMATDLEAALPTDSAAPAADVPLAASPVPTEPTPTVPPAETTPEPAPVTTAPAETAPAPQTDATPL